MSNARNNILSLLRQKRQKPTDLPEVYKPDNGWDQKEKLKRLTDNLSAVRSEVIHLTDGNWVDWLNDELPKRKLNKVLVGQSEAGALFKQKASGSINVQSYDNNIESWKAEFFKEIEVGITGCYGAIAETGSLILWPDAQEPRLMSLVPPVHIALLDGNQIFETFAEAMQQQNWADSMPTNALLISGPSKTADIEQTLAYGIHGPKQLIVLILG